MNIPVSAYEVRACHVQRSDRDRPFFARGFNVVALCQIPRRRAVGSLLSDHRSCEISLLEWRSSIVVLSAIPGY